MKRIRRRRVRDRVGAAPTPEQRAYWAWRAARLKGRLDPGHHDAEAVADEAIRYRRWSSAEWLRLRVAGLSPDEARREMQHVPPWVTP